MNLLPIGLHDRSGESEVAMCFRSMVALDFCLLVEANDVDEVEDRIEGEEGLKRRDGGVKDIRLKPCGYGGRLLCGVNVTDL